MCIKEKEKEQPQAVAKIEITKPREISFFINQMNLEFESRDEQLNQIEPVQ